MGVIFWEFTDPCIYQALSVDGYTFHVHMIICPFVFSEQ